MAQPLPCSLHPQEPVVAACARCGDFACRFCMPPSRRTCPRCTPNLDAVIERPDLGKGMKFVFQDPAWASKIGLGAVCILTSFFIVPMLAFLGYTIRVARREREAPQTTLPEWEDWGGLVGEGVKLWVASMLPGFAIALVSVVLVALGFGVVLLLGQGTKSPGLAGGLAAGGFLLFIVLMIPLSFAFAYAQPAMKLHYLRTNRITAMLEVGAIWRIVSGRPGDYFNLAVSCFVSQLIANFVGQLLCGVGILATVPWALYTDAWLVGRYWAWLDATESAGGV